MERQNPPEDRSKSQISGDLTICITRYPEVLGRDQPLRPGTNGPTVLA